jgi:hypothetical protein
VAAVRHVLPFETDGFRFLKKKGLLELTVESLLLRLECRDLFNDAARALAKRKLL